MPVRSFSYASQECFLCFPYRGLRNGKHRRGVIYVLVKSVFMLTYGGVLVRGSHQGVCASQELFLCLPYGGVLMAGQSGSMC